jgi:hypothetical protein
VVLANNGTTCQPIEYVELKQTIIVALWLVTERGKKKGFTIAIIYKPALVETRRFQSEITIFSPMFVGVRLEINCTPQIQRSMAKRVVAHGGGMRSARGASYIVVAVPRYGCLGRREQGKSVFSLFFQCVMYGFPVRPRRTPPPPETGVTSQPTDKYLPFQAKLCVKLIRSLRSVLASQLLVGLLSNQSQVDSEPKKKKKKKLVAIKTEIDTESERRVVVFFFFFFFFFSFGNASRFFPPTASYSATKDQQPRTPHGASHGHGVVAMRENRQFR